MPRKSSTGQSATPKRAPTAAAAPPAKSARPADSVEALLDTLQHPQRPLIDAMRALVVRAVPAAAESIKWNAPSFATAEHFATFHLRGKGGVQLILHLGARPQKGIDMRDVIDDDLPFLEWKGADRAVVTIRDAAHLDSVRTALTRLLRAWAAQVR
jgi:hypothetical protein